MLEKLLEILDDIDKTKVSLTKVRYTYNGIPVPSVTQILSRCIHEDFLMSWANSLGFRHIKYHDELNKAANMGTAGHNAVEAYLRDGTECDNVPYKSFRIWWDMLTANNDTKILGMEQEMVLPYASGTYDLLLEINGKKYLVDLKTSNNVGYKYFIQLAAYKHLLYNTMGVVLDGGCLILQLDKFEPSFEEYMLDFSNTEHLNFINQCEVTFLSLAMSYYSVDRTESMFKQLF
jgi:hypothetical protein